MAYEPHGPDWRSIAPESVRSFSLPPDDDRTTFVACSTYPAIDDEARYHMKVTKDIVHSKSKEAIGKPIIDAHGFNDVHGGTVVATGVDDRNRIWTVGALNYDTTGNSLKKRLRKGEFGGVSWRMAAISYQNPIDKQLQVDKQFVNLSLAQKPEYEEAKIFYVSDDPFPVKKDKTMHTIERMLSETLSKKQTVQSTQTNPLYFRNQTPPVAMAETNTVPDSTTSAAAAASVNANTNTNPAIDATQQQAKATETAVPKVAENAETKSSVETVAQTPAAAATTTQQPTQTAPPHQQYMQQPPVINYNFGLPFTSQNQFGAATSAISQPNVPSPDTQAQMSTPATSSSSSSTTANQEKAAASAPTTVVPPSEKPAEQPATSATPTYVPPKEFVDDLRRSIVGEVRNLFADFEKTRASSTPAIPAAAAAAAAATPATAASSTPAAQPTPAAETTTPAGPSKVQIEQIHAAIARVGQMRNQIVEQERLADAIAPTQKTADRLENESAIESMKQEVLETTNALIEGVERHHSNYRSQFKINGNSIVDNEIARMKGKVAQGQQLSQDDLRWLGTTIEITSESSFGHQRELEAAEQRLAAERRRFASQVPTGTQGLSYVDSLRKVLGVDPRRESGVKRPAESQFVPEKPKMSRVEEFRRQTGIPWTPIDTSQLTHNNAPPPPTTSISSLSREYRINLMPVPACQDSIFRNGLAYDPTFSGLIAETRNQATQGVELTQTLSREGWEYVERMNK